MATIGILSPSQFNISKSFTDRHGTSKRLDINRNLAPEPIFLRRSLRVLCKLNSKSSSPANDSNETSRDDFVSKVLKENPSQVEPKYRIGDKLYTLKEKENLSKNFNFGVLRVLAERLSLKNGQWKKENGEGKNEISMGRDSIYLKDLLREYRGKLYVPEQIFGRELSEEEEFDQNLESLPKMSIDEFQKAINSGKIKLLISKDTGSFSGYNYKDFVVQLKEIPGDKRLHRTKW